MIECKSHLISFNPTYMKKTIILLLVGTLLGTAITYAASRRFSDVPENTWYTDAVNELSDKGLINGYENGNYGPEGYVNRAEIAVMMQRMLRFMEENQFRYLSMEEARAIAEFSSCKNDGNLTNENWHNANTKTWWFDLDTEKPGCNPACVVDENTHTAEINWMCTGLLQ